RGGPQLKVSDVGGRRPEGLPAQAKALALKRQNLGVVDRAVNHRRGNDLSPSHRPVDLSPKFRTAGRVFDHLADIQRHCLIRDGQAVQPFEPHLTPLQAQLLYLHGVPANAYVSTN
ncbi:MAG: hypothetical protein WAP37_06870, partial [Solirubrobacterales bacterium]